MKDILRQVEAILPDGIALLEQIVNMESPSTDKALVDRLVDLLAGRFAEIGAKVERVSDEKVGDHLDIRFEGRAERPVMLLGHTDTVFPAGEAAERPFRIEDDRATGPGIFDMKAGVVMMWMAARALIELRGQPANPLTIVLTSDEEIGGRGSRQLIEERARASKTVLVLEPSLPGGVLKTARKGVGRFTIKTIGRATHSGINPEEGINSIEEMAHQVLRMQAMSDFEIGTTVSVGVIRGGTRSNVVPYETAVDVDVRTPSIDEARRVTEAIRGLQPVLPGSKIEVRGGVSRPPMERTADTVRLFEIARGIASELGQDLGEGSTGGASDGNFTAAMGIPTLDGLGPVGRGPHQVDEYIEVSSLGWRTALIAGLIERID